ncbi:MAG: Imidazole glycerol phosphate synthase subunit HisH [Candidatus Roizmanbacteria bacterium GW2011_GWA2_33_33]|uniref:Imidazole glycerol phosphate synthase subunit HisH n=2 Tax=Candidatus Roizmaniibacteriota TaxID=1752723 RepID=A0A0G0AV03_9BACT|nr:MAG: Imidazole glycerol phosphate synthase subunit HisH [Candidatus Roizmanbacteria bacterium GW2011_GWA2_33_33]KKP61008.1 MAG: Imidazole glycerol phosphate synthase subunit HisH [Candidatus Roizmanbacteria bacterium GW2011_GWC2_34_23]
MIVIIDYGLGNLGSVKNTLNKLGVDSVISKSKNDIEKADALILPGVGSAKQGMENLKTQCLDKVLINEIKKGKPFLGICLGMQLLFSESEEGNVKCLNVINGKVKKFNSELKVPQIGWNEVRIKSLELRVKNLFKNVLDKSSFYFVNSFYCLPDDKSVIVGETEYGINYCSILIKNNITATQFHPEKSGQIGQRFIKNWIKLI